MALYMQSPQDPPKKKRGYFSKDFWLGSFLPPEKGIEYPTEEKKKRDIFSRDFWLDPFVSPSPPTPDYSGELAKIMSYKPPVQDKTTPYQVPGWIQSAQQQIQQPLIGGVIAPAGTTTVPAQVQTTAPQTRFPNIPTMKGIRAEGVEYGTYDKATKTWTGGPGFPRDETLTAKPDYVVPEEEVAGEMSLSMADLYKQGLDKAVRRGNLVNLAEAGLNIGQLLRQYPESEKLKAPEFETPRLQSPSKYITQAEKDVLGRATAGYRKAVTEAGREDLLVAGVAEEIARGGEIAARGAMMDVETMNKNIIAEAETQRAEAIAKVETDKYNIEKQIKENLIAGQTISQAISNLGEIGRQYVNRMTEAEFNKWYADILQEEMGLKRMGLT
jgi:hypothetical protein